MRTTPFRSSPSTRASSAAPPLDPEGRRGTAALMAALLDEGAGALDSAAFATALEDLAADIGFSTSDDDVRLSATMLTDTRDATTDLLRLALTEPRFDAEPVERLRAQTLASIQQNDADPRTRAGVELLCAGLPRAPLRQSDQRKRGVGGRHHRRRPPRRPRGGADPRAASGRGRRRHHRRRAAPPPRPHLRGAARDRTRAPRRRRAAHVRRDHRARLRHPAVGGVLRQRRTPQRRSGHHPGAW